MFSSHSRAMFPSWTPTQRHYAHAARPARLPAWIRLLAALALILTICDVLASAFSPLAWILAAPLVALALYYDGESVLVEFADAHAPEPDAAVTGAGVPAAKRIAHQQMRDWHRDQLAELVGTCTQEQIGQVRTLLTRIERVWARLWVEHEALGAELERTAADVPQTAAQHRAMGQMRAQRAVIVARADRLERLGRTLPERIATLAGGYAPDAVRQALSLAMVEAQFGIDRLAS